jgi:hypothetical protein
MSLVRTVNITTLLGLIFIWGCVVEVPPEEGEEAEDTLVSGQLTVPATAVATTEFPATVVLMNENTQVSSVLTDAEGNYDLGTHATSINHTIVAKSATGDYGTVITFATASSWTSPKELSLTGTITGSVTLSGEYYRNQFGTPDLNASTVQINGLPQTATGALAGQRLLLSDTFIFTGIPADDWSLTASTQSNDGNNTGSQTIADVTLAAGTTFADVDFHIGGDANNSKLAELLTGEFDSFEQTTVTTNTNFDINVQEYNASRDITAVNFSAYAQDRDAVIQLRIDGVFIEQSTTRELDTAYNFAGPGSYVVVLRVISADTNFTDYTLNLDVSTFGGDA